MKREKSDQERSSSNSHLISTGKSSKMNIRKLKNTKMSLHEDSTKANRSLIWEATKATKLQGSNVLSAWSANGRIIVSVKTTNGSMKRQINSKEDLPVAIG